MKPERFYSPDVEIRAVGDGSRLTGYAAVFNKPTELFEDYFEVVRPGAFTKTIQEADVRAFWNHDKRQLPLGRTKSGTLRLSEDDTGLAFEIDPPESEWARNVVESVRRGDVDKTSFAFIPIREQETRQEDGTVLRELFEVRLVDVSPVNYPAYEDTVIQARKEQVRARLEQHEERTSEDEPGLAAHSRRDRMARALRLIEARTKQLKNHGSQV